MKVQLRKAGNISILDCTGEIDLYSSPQLRNPMLLELRNGPEALLVNMTDVRYVDSSGIATLVEGLQLSRQVKVRFGLFGLHSNARSVLELARLDRVFNLFKDEAEALEKIPSLQPFKGV
jgi:anti-sigma B factor antagonist